MSRIVVAGAGHGGLVAAYHLAMNGEDVTVYEKNKRKKLGYDWQDSFDYKCYSYAELPIPETGMKDRVPMTFVPSTNPYISFSQGKQLGRYSLHLFRKDIYNHLISLCEKAGVEFCFETEIYSSVLFGNRVCGIKTNRGDFYGDLVIDAAGMYSPVKNSLPDYMAVPKTFAGCEVLHAYRAYFEKNNEFPDPENEYQVLFNENGDIGLGWVVTREDYIDVLVGRFGDFNMKMAEKAIENLRVDFPCIGKKIVHGGSIADIPVRQPISVFVADGYAAIGDSACMTIPVIGSGLTNSIMAGKMLADTVKADEYKKYDAAHLWEYEKQYYKEIGNKCSAFALCKVMMNSLSPEDIIYLIEEEVLTTDDISFNVNDSSIVEILLSGGMTIPSLLGKAKKLKSNDELFKKLVTLAGNAAKLKTIQVSFPNQYSLEDIQAWSERYENFFASIAVEPKTDEKLL
ncbi:MAG: NAD(P)/FAD-dependent oxidoreductase [Clostridia bacterium]|nr:NAD(P)/FAD-dependent oxidoreductase [Clostridia bacterium]